jgi:molecular chaperone DnaJ
MSKRDYYEILGVPKSTTAAEIKKAYRKLAMKWHPDRNPGDKTAEIKFKEVQEAYAVLSNPQKRSAYDQFGHAGVGGNGGFGGFGGAGGFNFDGVSDIFDNIFGDIFGGGRSGGKRQRTQKRKGSDLAYELTLTLEEVFHGVVKEIKVVTHVNCKVCHGSGAAKGSSPVTCPFCQGTGMSRVQHGFLTMEQTCSKCHGQGTVIKNPCVKCHGQGRVQERKTLSVKVPAGVDNGDRIRLTGEGEVGMNGGPAGDLYVQIRVRKHDLFERQDSDLLSEIPVSFVTAALGGEVEIPTLDGHVVLKIPPETQTGKLFRLRGKGIKSMRRHAPGDLLCHVVIETPVRLSGAQKKLLKEFADNLSKDKVDHSPRTVSWLDSVKRFFHKITG